MPDGETIRQRLSKGLGFSRRHRDENIRRVAFVAELPAKNGVTVIVAAIIPYRDVRGEVRSGIPASSKFVSMHRSTFANFAT